MRAHGFRAAATLAALLVLGSSGLLPSGLISGGLDISRFFLVMAIAGLGMKIAPGARGGSGFRSSSRTSIWSCCGRRIT